MVDMIFTAIGGAGLFIAGLGIGLDLVPGTSPGLSYPQLLMILGGIVLSLAGWLLRRQLIRSRLASILKPTLIPAIVISALTLLGLEVALAALGAPTYFPPDEPEQFLTPAPWWTCDQAGCHYVYEEIKLACERGEIKGRRCIVNRQGFHDTQDFDARPDLDQRSRLLILGDSFAFGGSASIGMSFVETLERHFPQGVIWNTAIPGAGTVQALLSYEEFAPILKPQLTILAFYMNDFDDNLLPADSYYMGVDSTGYQLSIRQYQIDMRGDVHKLDQQSDLYFRWHGVDPPASQAQHHVGNTRIGSLALRSWDAMRQMISKADGLRLSRQVEVTRGLLLKLRDAAADSTKLLVLLIPRREDLDAPGDRYLAAHRILDELGMPVLDPIVMLDKGKDYAKPPDIHWSTTGHQKIASC